MRDDMEINYDLMIIGSGLVGVSLAAALASADLNIIILETHLPVQDTAADSRPLALNYISQQILMNLGIWPKLADLAQPIKQVHISQQNHFGFLQFQAAEENVPALGYVVPIGELQNALYQAAEANSRIKYVSIQKLLHIKNRDSAIKSRDDGLTQVIAQTIEGEKQWAAELVVIADGAHSPARELLGIEAIERSSGDVALTFTLELDQMHSACAYERFVEEGVIAVMPLKNPRHCRIVWTLKKELAASVGQWSETQLNDFFYSSLRGRLGHLRVLERGKAFPLQMVFAKEQVRPGVVLMGNAAHTLYPLAAQGFNLALRDVAWLAEVLRAARKQHFSLGAETVLQDYLQLRDEDQRWISRFVGSVGEFFDLRLPLLGAVRGVGLLTMGLIPPLKHRLASRLLGKSGKLPKLARGIAI